MTENTCSSCNQVSVQLWVIRPCDHTACSSCLSRSEDMPMCSSCKSPIDSLRCPGSTTSCGFNGLDWKDHEDKCPCFPVQCPNRCEVVTSKKEIVSHLSSECRLRLGECTFCSLTFLAVSLPQHVETCPEQLVSCVFCEQGDIKRGLLSEHAAGCSKTPKPCPLADFGCTFTGLDDEINEHLSVRNHLVCFEKIKKELSDRDAEITRLRSEMDSCNNELAERASGGVQIFDKELLWLADPPMLYRGKVISQLYRQRDTADTFILSCERMFREIDAGTREVNIAVINIFGEATRKNNALYSVSVSDTASVLHDKKGGLSIHDLVQGVAVTAPEGLCLFRIVEEV